MNVEKISENNLSESWIKSSSINRNVAGEQSFFFFGETSWGKSVHFWQKSLLYVARVTCEQMQANKQIVFKSTVNP